MGEGQKNPKILRTSYVDVSLSLSSSVRGHAHMMSEVGGGTPKADKSTDKLRECDTDNGGGGNKIPKNCGRHIYMPPYQDLLAQTVSRGRHFSEKTKRERERKRSFM